MICSLWLYKKVFFMFVSVVCCHKKNVTASVRHKTQQHIDLGTARARFIYAIIFAQYALAVSQ